MVFVSQALVEIQFSVPLVHAWFISGLSREVDVRLCLSVPLAGDDVEVVDSFRCLGDMLAAVEEMPQQLVSAVHGGGSSSCYHF